MPYDYFDQGFQAGGAGISSLGQAMQQIVGQYAKRQQEKNDQAKLLKILGLDPNKPLTPDVLKTLPSGTSIPLPGGGEYKAPQPQMDLPALLTMLNMSGNQESLKGMKPKLTIGKGGASVSLTEDPSEEIKSTIQDFLKGRNPEILKPEERKDLLNNLYDNNPSLASAVEQVSNFKTTPQEAAGMFGAKRTDIVGLAKMINPDYGAETEKLVQKARLDTAPSGYAGKAKQALNTLIGHVDNLYSAMQSLDNTNIPAVNAIKNFTAKHSGMAQITRAYTDALPVANEFERVMKGTGATAQKGIDQWLKNIPVNGSKDQQRAWLEEGQKLLGRRGRSLEKNVNDILGKAGENWNILDPESENVLNKYGLMNENPQQENVPVIGGMFNGEKITNVRTIK